MIYFKPHRGLGNTLFQIAAIWTLAKDNGDELCLLDVNKHNVALNSLGRGNLTYLFNRFSSIEGIPNGDFLKINNQVLKYPNIHYAPIEYKKEHLYVGEFISEKYFKHRRNEILELFKCPDEFNDKINQYSHLFGSISLHVRRGDYVPNSWLFSVATIEYYNKALSLMPDDKYVVIFSDDLNWCRQNFIGERYVFIDEVDYISLYLMTKMKYHINASSTFSWWGAWMSDSEKIVTPKQWFAINNNHYNDKDICPENWIKI